MHDSVITRQLGRPCRIPLSDEESMLDNRKKAGGQKRRRASDRLIGPEKAGNAAGGKEATVDRAG